MASYRKTRHDNRGIGLILAISVMSLLLFLSMYFLSTSLSEKLIARNQSYGVRAYYLAEAGIAEMVWLIQNDPAFADGFENDPAWATTTVRTDPFGPGSGYYSVSVTNLRLAHGEVISTGYIDLGGGKTTQRAVKTLVYKAMGESGVEDSSGYADGNIDISASNVNFYSGSSHSNNTFTVNNGANVNVESTLRAVGNYLEHVSANVTIAGLPSASAYPCCIQAANYPPAAEEIAMPGVDFDYYKNWAIASGTYYTANAFDDILKNNLTVTLNDAVTYVDGSVSIQGERVLTINNGLLVVDKDFTVGFKKQWESGDGPSSLYITHASGTAAGILAGRHVDFKEYTGVVDVAGVIYARDQMNLTNLDTYTTAFDITGGLVARKLTMTSCWLPTYINITHDNNILMDTFGVASSSQVIVVEHWEEEY